MLCLQLVSVAPESGQKSVVASLKLPLMNEGAEEIQNKMTDTHLLQYSLVKLS